MISPDPTPPPVETDAGRVQEIRARINALDDDADLYVPCIGGLMRLAGDGTYMAAQAKEPALAALIGHAPKDLPWLLSRLATAEAENGRLRTALKQITMGAPTPEDIRDGEWGTDPSDPDDQYNLGAATAACAAANIARDALAPHD